MRARWRVRGYERGAGGRGQQRAVRTSVDRRRSRDASPDLLRRSIRAAGVLPGDSGRRHRVPLAADGSAARRTGRRAARATRQAARQARSRRAPRRFPSVSTVTGTRASGETFDATYWGRNLREPFLFARGVRRRVGGQRVALLPMGGTGHGANAHRNGITGGIRACIEISPDAVLSSSIGQCASGGPAVASRSCRRCAARRTNRCTSSNRSRGVRAGRARCSGAASIARGVTHRCRPYPWQRQRFWFTISSRRPSRGAPTRRNGALRGPRMAGTAHTSRLAEHARWRMARMASRRERRQRSAVTGVAHRASDMRRIRPSARRLSPHRAAALTASVCGRFEADATRPHGLRITKCSAT